MTDTKPLTGDTEPLTPLDDIEAIVFANPVETALLRWEFGYVEGEAIPEQRKQDAQEIREFIDYLTPDPEEEFVRGQQLGLLKQELMQLQRENQALRWRIARMEGGAS